MELASPFRATHHRCPRCRTELRGAGKLQRCPSCEGAWIGEDMLHEHVVTMQLDVNPRLALVHVDDRSSLPCAVCLQAMETLALFEVPIDRCREHGVWFDKDELAEALHRSAQHVKPAPASASASPLDAVEVAALPLEIVETAVAADVGASMLDGLIDVLGGILSALDL
jgi:Zn-finger nucleic acid-binding protein